VPTLLPVALPGAVYYISKCCASYLATPLRHTSTCSANCSNQILTGLVHEPHRAALTRLCTCRCCCCCCCCCPCAMLLGLQTCTQLWKACGGPVDTCCAGSSCQLTSKSWNTPPYVCKPLPTDCKPASTHLRPQYCGNCAGGGVCCPGLECRWDSHTRKGHCVDTKTCCELGAVCKTDASAAAAADALWAGATALWQP
jgi:hypothetical protein